MPPSGYTIRRALRREIREIEALSVEAYLEYQDGFSKGAAIEVIKRRQAAMHTIEHISWQA